MHTLLFLWQPLCTACHPTFDSKRHLQFISAFHPSPPLPPLHFLQTVTTPGVAKKCWSCLNLFLVSTVYLDWPMSQWKMFGTSLHLCPSPSPLPFPPPSLPSLIFLFALEMRLHVVTAVTESVFSFPHFVWVMLSLCFTDSYLCAVRTVTCVVQFLGCTDSLSLCCRQLSLCSTDSYLCCTVLVLYSLSLCCTVISVLYRQLCLCCTDSYRCVVKLSLCCTVISVLYRQLSLCCTVIFVLYRQLSLCCADSYPCVVQLSLCCTDIYLCVVQTVISVLSSYLCVVQLSLCCTDSYLCVVQTVAMLNEEELRKEVTMLERTLRVKLCMQKLLSRPRLSESMGEFLLLFFFFHWE